MDLEERIAEIGREIDAVNSAPWHQTGDREIEIIDSLGKSIFLNAEEIKGNPTLLQLAGVVVRKTIHENWMGESFSGFVYRLSLNQFPFCEPVLLDMLNATNASRYADSNFANDIMTAYLRSIFQKEGILDKSEYLFERGLILIGGSYSPVIENMGMYRPQEAVKVTEDLRDKLFKLAKSNYMLLHQGMALSSIVYLELKGFVPHAKAMLKSTAELLDAPGRAQESTLHWRGTGNEQNHPTYAIVSRIRNLASSLRHLTGDPRYDGIREFYRTADDGKLQWISNVRVALTGEDDGKEKLGGSYGGPYAPSFLAEFKRRTDKLIREVA